MRESSAAAGRYLAEVYTSRRELSQVEARTESLRAATAALAASGIPIRHLQVVFVPEEETCFHLFEAAGPESVAQVLRQAGLEPERISEAFESSAFRRGER